MKTRLLFLSLLLLGSCNQGPASETATDEAKLHFTDVTASSGLLFQVTSGGTPPTYLLDTLGTGIALIDYDMDGDPDVFIANGATVAQPQKGPGCRLFENLGHLQFQDVTQSAGLKFSRWGCGLAEGDFDNDGWPDLFLSCYGENVLLRNTGKGGFEDVSAHSGIRGSAWSTGASFGDIDGDGDLDLYVVNYCGVDLSKPSPRADFLGVRVFAGPMGLEKIPDVLYRNDGQGKFTDISQQSGIRTRPGSWGLSAVILDFDGDQIQDIYVGNDSTASYFYRGLGDGTFQEDGIFRGVALGEGGAGQATMGIAVGDVDGNGRPDLFTTNFMYDTNTLHLNQSKDFFIDSTMAYGLHLDSRPFLSWATGFFDFDHDADEDLIFFNGNIYPEETCVENNWDYKQVPVLYTREDHKFRRLQANDAGDWLTDPYCDRAAAFGDLDGDGDIDIVVSENNGPLRVLRNDRDGGDWLIVRLRDDRPSHEPFGTGSEILLRTEAKVQRRWLASGRSYFAANQPIAHFAFPRSVKKATLEILWPDGFQQKIAEVSPRQTLVVHRE